MVLGGELFQPLLDCLVEAFGTLSISYIPAYNLLTLLINLNLLFAQCLADQIVQQPLLVPDYVNLAVDRLLFVHNCNFQFVALSYLSVRQ